MDYMEEEKKLAEMERKLQEMKEDLKALIYLETIISERIKEKK